MQTTFDPDKVAQYEHEVWERCAKRYVESWGALVSQAIEPLLDAADVAAGRRVLDVGSGPGLVAASVHDRGGEAVGIDFSTTMVSVARKSYPGIEFQDGNAESLAFESAAFDAVVGNFVLHHLAQPVAALKEAHRVLRDGGKIAHTVWADLSKLVAFGLFFSAVEEHGDPEELPHGPLFGVSDVDVFHGMLREAGFHESRVTEVTIGWRMASIDSLLSAFRDWANMDAFSEPVRTAIEASVRVKAKAYASGTALILPNPAILISAVK